MPAILIYDVEKKHYLKSQNYFSTYFYYSTLIIMELTIPEFIF